MFRPLDESSPYRREDDPGDRPAHLDFALSFILNVCGEEHSSATWRLKAFENVLARLVVHWRPMRRIDPKRELRMTYGSMQTLLAWVQAREFATDETRERIADYWNLVSSDGVAAGWVRFILD